MFELSEKFNEFIKIDAYKDSRSLVLAQKGNDGKEYIQWSSREMGKERKVVKRPVGLTFESEYQLKQFSEWLMRETMALGDKSVTVEALRAMLNELIGTEPIPDSPPF